MEPKWSQHGITIDVKTMSKNQWKNNRFLNDFWSIWGAKLGHVGDIFGRNWHARIEPDTFRVLFAAKIVSRGFRIEFLLISDRFWNDFESILGPFSYKSALSEEVKRCFCMFRSLAIRSTKRPKNELKLTQNEFQNCTKRVETSNQEGRAREEEGRQKRAKRRSKLQLSFNQQTNMKSSIQSIRVESAATESLALTNGTA